MSPPSDPRIAELVRVIGECERELRTLTDAPLEQVRDVPAEPLAYGRAVELLHESEERYQQLFEMHPHPMWVYDLETLRFLAVNDAAVQAYGYSREQFLAMRITDVRPDADVPAILETVRGLVPGMRHSGIWRHRTSTGRLLNVEISSHELEYAGRPASLVMAQDVTARVAAEAALREGVEAQRRLTEALEIQRARLEEAQRVARLGSWETDLVTLEVYWSDEIYRICGLEPGAFTPTHPGFIDLVLPADREAVSAAFVASFDTRSVCSIVHRILLADGSIRHVEERWRTYVDAAGVPARAVGTCQDVTIREEEAAIREQQQALLAVASQISLLGAFRVDLETGERIWSDGLSRIFDLPPGETPPLDEALGFYPPEHRELMESSYRRCVTEGIPYDLELRALTRKGRQVWLRTIGEPIRNREGVVIGLQGATQDITERREAVEAMIQSEERFRRIFASAPMGIIVASADGHFLEVNEAFCRMVGYPAEELRRLTFADLTHPDDLDMSLGQAASLRGSGVSVRQFEKRYRTKSGQHIWVRLNVAAPRELEGRPFNFITVVEDITAMRSALDALRESDERFRLLTRATNDAIWDWDLVTGTHWWNEGFETLFGYRPENLESGIDIWTTNLHPEDHDRVTSSREAAIASGESQWAAEYRFARHDGSYADVHDRGHIIRNAEGQAVRMIGGMTDVTHRKVSERRINQLAALLDASHEAIVVKTMDDRIAFWNKGAERVFGWTREEAIGQRASELFQADPEAYFAAHHALLANGQWAGELAKFSRDGVRRTMEVYWTLARDDAGQPASVFAIDVDITGRKQLELQLFRAQRLESLGTLAGGIAHDLNNVLAPILASVEMLRLDEIDQDRRASLASIEASARRGATMVRQVLSFARGAEGEPVVLDLRAVVKDLERMLLDTFPKNIHLATDSDTELWCVSGDATQIHQVLLNLCVNARDAMPEGGTLSITLRNAVLGDAYVGMHPGAQAGSYVRISVVDTGQGILPEHQTRLFEPFFTTKEVGKGTGLGLSTVYAIVQVHKGLVNIYSEIGHGARFDVYLPALLDAGATARQGREQQQLPRGSGELVLVVDDEQSIRDVVQRVLERFGYRVLLAANGAEGVALYVQHHAGIAAVLTDMAMPVMDGPAMTVALMAINPEVRIIGSSGFATDDGLARAVGGGVRRFIPKPYTVETLLRALHEVLH